MPPPSGMRGRESLELDAHRSPIAEQTADLRAIFEEMARLFRDSVPMAIYEAKVPLLQGHLADAIMTIGDCDARARADAERPSSVVPGAVMLASLDEAVEWLSTLEYALMGRLDDYEIDPFSLPIGRILTRIHEVRDELAGKKAVTS